jgi:hypothetical protein
MNYSSPSKKVPNSLSFLSIDDLNQDYLAQLKERIPILKNKLLLQLILNYGVELANNKPKIDIDTSLQKINKLIYFLSLQSEIPENLNNSNFKSNRPNNINFESYTYFNETNQIYIKTHSLDAKGLIEAIIQFTLHYYNPGICPELVSMNINNIPLRLENPLINIRKRFKQKMTYYNPDSYISLGEYLTLLFKSNKPDIEKLTIFKNILIEIANKINKMRQFGFIHGDFHSGNIYLDNENNVYFIDFGYSCIKLPLSNGSFTNFLLCVPVPNYTCILNTKLRFPYYYDQLVKIDLFHLIENINTLEINNDFFKKLMKVVRQEYLNYEIQSFRSTRHYFTCSNKLDFVNNFFNPEEFISYFEKLKINNIKNNSNNNSMNNNSMNNISMNNNHTGITKFGRPSGILFEHNSNNN